METSFIAVAHVLVVDDSKVMRDMVSACLSPADDVTVAHATTGLEAIEKLSLDRFDLMILDLNMPDIGGLEVLDFVRKQDRLRSLPILVLTTRGDETSRSSAIAAGASRYMTKPFTPDALLGEAQALLESTREAPRAG